MALQIWLPLTKQTARPENCGIATENKGTSSYSNTTFDTSEGKIGSSYKFNGSNSAIIIATGLTLNDKNWSYCCWAKLANNSNTMCLYSQRVGVVSDQRTIFLTPSKGIYVDDGTRYQGTLNTNATLTDWTHYCIVRNGNNITVYINGVSAISWTATTFPASMGTISMFGASQDAATTISGNVLNGWMNDIRLYDHALSKREIHEINKGLILHYMLSKPDNVNYFVNSNFYNGTSGWYGVNSSSIRIESKDGRKCITGTKGTTSNICGQTLSGYSYVANSQVTFTISADIYVEETGTFGIGNWISTTEASGWQGMSGQMRSNTPMDLKVGWNHVSATRINGSNQYNGSIVTAFSYTGTTYWMTNVKFEFGGKETPWLPNSTDTAIYTFMGYDTNQESDCSGYQNNGSKVGTLTSTSDSPRNSSAMQFPGQTTTYIQAPSMSINMNNATFSIWAKWTAFNTWSRIFDFGEKTSGGGYAFLVANNGSILTVAGRLSGGASLPDTQIQTIATNTWYHIAVTINNAECKTYINGSLVKTFNFNSAMGRASFLLNYLGKSNWSSDAAFAGILSDFRVYVTTLSADDILELYNAPINFNKHSTMIQGEFIEK